MGWDVSLNMDGIPVKVDPHWEGSIIQIGGGNEYADITITYNYSPFYYNSLDPKLGIKWLHGKKARFTLRRLKKAIDKLGIIRADSYWSATEGNAGYVLAILYKWASLYPNAIWSIT